MKKLIIIILVFQGIAYSSYSQNVGIGTTIPAARLHVADSAVLFSGTGIAPPPTTSTPPPVQGPGTRAFWFPSLGAFRTGYVDGVQWDKDSIGSISFAAGMNTKAKGTASMAFGYNTNAIGSFSSSFGSFTTASGIMSTSMGWQTVASGIRSTAMGQSTTALGVGSTATGGSTYALGNYSFAANEQTFAKARGSFSVGLWNEDTDNPDPNTPASTDRIFQIGNGTATKRSTSMTVLRNGNIGVGTTFPYYPLHVYTAATNIFATSIENIDSTGWGLEIRTADKSGNRSALEIYSENISRFVIRSNGKVGIGVEAPNALLQFSNSSINRKIVLFEAGNNDNAVHGFGAASNFLRYQIADLNSSHIFYAGIDAASSQELIRFQGNGNIGVGVSDPVFLLDIGGRMRLRATTGLSAGSWLNNEANTTSPAFIGMRADTEVGFYGQTGTPGWRFYVNTTDGNAWLQGSLTQNSDARLKKNIVPLCNSLHSLLELNGYTYNWIDTQSDSTKQIGLIAQEVQKLYPQLVKENDKGVLSVNYTGLIPVLLEGMKEQQQQIEDLKKLVLQLAEKVK